MVQGGLKGGPVGFWSLSHAFWLKLYNTKVAGHPQLSGGWSPYRTPNPDLEGPGPSALLEPWCLILRRVYKIKVVVNVPNSAWPQGPGRPMSGYLNILYSSY